MYAYKLKSFADILTHSHTCAHDFEAFTCKSQTHTCAHTHTQEDQWQDHSNSQQEKRMRQTETLQNPFSQGIRKVADQDSLVEVLLEEIKVLQQLHKETSEAADEGEMHVASSWNIQKALEDDLYAAQSLQVSLVLHAEDTAAKHMGDVTRELSLLGTGVEAMEEAILLLQSAVWREELITTRDAAVVQAEVAIQLRAVDKRAADRFESAAQHLVFWKDNVQSAHVGRSVLHLWRQRCRVLQTHQRTQHAMARRRFVAVVAKVWHRMRRLVTVQRKLTFHGSRSVFRLKKLVLCVWARQRHHMEAMDNCCNRVIRAQLLLGSWASKSLYFAGWQRAVANLPVLRRLSQSVVDDLSVRLCLSMPLHVCTCGCVYVTCVLIYIDIFLYTCIHTCIHTNI